MIVKSTHIPSSIGNTQIVVESDDDSRHCKQSKQIRWRCYLHFLRRAAKCSFSIIYFYLTFTHLLTPATTLLSQSQSRAPLGMWPKIFLPWDKVAAIKDGRKSRFLSFLFALPIKLSHHSELSYPNDFFTFTHNLGSSPAGSGVLVCTNRIRAWACVWTCH